MTAILSFDLEDWFQLTSRRFGISVGRATQGRLSSQLARILDLLDAHRARATFFVLGRTAEASPGVVRQVVERGHEVASHGFGHDLVRDLTPEAFSRDLAQSVNLLGELARAPILGYRAPEFSIGKGCYWAFDIMLDCGIQYDSSVFPIRGPRYGVPDSPLSPYIVQTPSGRSITELPLAVLEVLGKRIPVAGGGYWRLLPNAALKWAVARVAQNRPAMLYFHPAEFDHRALNLSFRNLAVAKFVIKQNVGRASIYEKLETFLRTQPCVSATQYLEANSPALAPQGAAA